MESALLDVKTEADLARAREFVGNVITLGTLSQRELAKRTGCKPTAISCFLHYHEGKWKGKQGTLYTLASDLCRAVDQFLQHRDAEETSIGGYVETRFAEEFYGVSMYAVKRRLWAVILAPAGSGKSTVMFAIREQIPGAVLVTASRCRSAPKPFLQLWARSLGLPEDGRAEDIQDRLITCLAGSDRLVLVDESHKLQVSTLDVIREVWDQARMPMVMAGTPSFYQTLHSRRVGTNTAEILDQLSSRVGIYRDLTTLTDPRSGDPERLFTVEDVRKLFARGRVRLIGDGADYLCRMANLRGWGGLRPCATVMQMAVDGNPGAPITRQMLEEAVLETFGPKVAGHLNGLMGYSESAAPAVKAALA